VLHVQSREDACRVRVKHEAQNVAILRHPALNTTLAPSGRRPRKALPGASPGPLLREHPGDRLRARAAKPLGKSRTLRRRRQSSVNRLRQDASVRGSLLAQRFRAALDHTYLLRLLAGLAHRWPVHYLT
jgi:hypothetical protein